MFRVTPSSRSQPRGTRGGRAGGLAPFTNGPDDQRLAAAHVAAGEHHVLARRVAKSVGGDIAALVERNAGLGQQPGLEIVAACSDPSSVLRNVARHRPSVVLTDLKMPDREQGLNLIRNVMEGHPNTRCVVLTYSEDPDDLFEANQAGAAAYVLKDSSLEEIATAVDTPPQTTRAKLRGDFIRAAQEGRHDYTVDWVHLKLNDQAQRTVLCKDPFIATDDRVERLIASMRS